MTCCLRAPSHYLTQCWLIISKALWLSSRSNFTKDIPANLRFQSNLPGFNELNRRWSYAMDQLLHHIDSRGSRYLSICIPQPKITYATHTLGLMFFRPKLHQTSCKIHGYDYLNRTSLPLADPSFTKKHKYRLKRKDKNKSPEEIFYQMKVFFLLRSIVGSAFCKSARCP